MHNGIKNSSGVLENSTSGVEFSGVESYGPIPHPTPVTHSSGVGDSTGLLHSIVQHNYICFYITFFNYFNFIDLKNIILLLSRSRNIFDNSD